MKYSPRNFPATYTALVAEATMHLPPLVLPEHEDMLRIATENVITDFWSEYVDCLPTEAKKAFLEATNDETGKKLFAWSHAYANFTEDDKAESRGQKILAGIANRLPKVLREMHEDIIATRSISTQ